MGVPILREETVEAFRECVLIAEEMHLFHLSAALKDTGLVKPEDLSDPSRVRVAFDGLLKAIDWNDRDSIRPIIPVFVDAYAESPIDFHTIHQKIDVELAHDGFQIKEGKLIQLPL
ncbi:MAG: hypothetical protein H7249_03815 [Chitinophagaceae bacterium]|nr:hypothetical protein [Oligoflexus sp.]